MSTLRRVHVLRDAGRTLCGRRYVPRMAVQQPDAARRGMITLLQAHEGRRLCRACRRILLNPSNPKR